MGKPQSTGNLVNAIAQDSSNNIGIGGAANASFKLQVTGTTNVTGVLTLGSTISNGTFTYTLPSATGTLALTSALSGYLPLTGGTLTGALSGTSATFSGNGLFGGSTNAGNAGGFTLSVGVPGTTAGGIQLWAATNQSSFLQFGDSTTPADNYRGYIGYNHATDTLSLGTASADKLTIASTGAATFSSSVTSDDLILTAGTLFGTGVTGFSNRASDTTLYLQMPATGFNITDNALNTKFIFSSTGAATFSDSVTNKVTNISADGAGVVLQGYVDNSLRIAVRGSGYNSGARGGLLASTGDFSSSVTAGGLYANAGNSARFYRGANDYYWGVNNDSNNYLNFGAYLANGTAYGTNPKMILLDNGNVGIGTSSPDNYYSTKLVVAVGDENGITIAGTGDNFLMFADGQTGLDRYRGFIHYSHDSNFLAFGSDATERMRITSGGEVLMHSTTFNSTNAGQFFGTGGDTYFTVDSSIVLYLNRKSTDGVILDFRKNNTTVGTISTNANSLPSDLNFKKNINTLELGLNLVTKLRAVSYNHKIDDEGAALSTGFIAQELEQSLNELGVQENEYYILQHKPNKDETQSQYWLDYTKMIPILVNAIKEQQAQIESQDAKIDELKALIAAK